jgi:hypothetical protein
MTKRDSLISNSNSCYSLDEISLNSTNSINDKFDSSGINENYKLLQLRDYYKKDVLDTEVNIKSKEPQEIICKICLNNQNNLDNFIILSCNHTFHIKCLTNIISSEEINLESKCSECLKTLEIEELLFLHSKFLSNTKNLIGEHEIKIKNLENNLIKLKEELKISYEYKNKLTNEREKSKQIVSNLSMLI